MNRFVLCAIVLPAALASAARGDEPRRVAVLVGANRGAVGRSDLRYSHSDARSVGDTLVQVGGFNPADVHVLLDPEPGSVLVALDRELAALRSRAGESLLVFYYSGHADGQALYPAGQPLLFRDLRARLEDQAATVRVGIVDACSGGSFTGAKGMQPSAPLVVDVPMQLSGEGSVLMASSSGLENAHESESILGSFFTHHLVAALRGAADVRGDGTVTLTDAFAYAKERTVRDSAAAADPQHPSFSMNLRGRSDLALVRVSRATTVVELGERQGPLQLIQLSSGVVVLEVPQGKRPMRLSVPAGRYLVRRQTKEGTWAREISVEPGRIAEVAEADLELSSALLAGKGLGGGLTAGPISHAARPASSWEWILLAGLAHGESPAYPSGLTRSSNSFAFVPFLAYAVTDRLEIGPFLAAYRIGEPGATEWTPAIVAAPLTVTGGGVQLALGLQLTMRRWMSPSTSLLFSADAVSTVAFGSPGVGGDPNHHGPDHWVPSVSAGLSTSVDKVIINLAVGLSQPFAIGRTDGYAAPVPSVSFLALQNEGGRLLPLVQYCLTDHLALDFHVGATLALKTGAVGASALTGFSYNY